MFLLPTSERMKAGWGGGLFGMRCSTKKKLNPVMILDGVENENRKGKRNNFLGQIVFICCLA